MKKIILFVLSLFIMPYFVDAMAVSESFYVGDSVSVGLISDNERVGFHVLEDSPAGMQYVTLIYDGVVVGGTVYDESIPADNHDATVVFNNSIAYEKMSKEIYKEGARWRVESAGLLTYEDLTNLGITKNLNGKYEIPEKYSFLNPRNLEGLSSEMYNYWTSISENNDSVYCVTHNASGNATLEAKNITSITSNEKCAIRPVVVVDKKYIICNNTRPTENVDTGVKDYLLPLSGVIILAAISIYLVNKKEVFKEI